MYLRVERSTLSILLYSRQWRLQEKNGLDTNGIYDPFIDRGQ